MNLHKKSKIFGLGGLIFLTATLAWVSLFTPMGWADPIGPDCPNGSCFGNIYTLEGFFLGNNAWNITLTINTSGYIYLGEWLSDVAVKIAPQNSDYLSKDPVSAPSGWTTSLSLSSGFLHDTNTAPSLDVPAGTLTWVWKVGIADNLIFLGLNEASVKAEFDRVGPNDKIQQRFTSENITLQTVPEPATLLLLGSGLLGLVGLTRKLRK